MLRVVRKSCFQNDMWFRVTSTQLGHIQAEKEQMQNQSISLPPPSSPWPGGRDSTLYSLPTHVSPVRAEGYAGGEKADFITVDPLSTASGPSAGLLHPFSPLQQKAGI